MTAFSPTFDQSRTYFESRLGMSLPARKEVPAKCLWHDDGTASMSVNLEKGSWFCHACDVGGGLLDFERKLTGKLDAECWDAINKTIGREASKASKSKRGPIVAAYDYHNADGTVAYQSLRYAEPKKDFKQRQPNGKGGWTWHMDGVSRVLFNLPALVRANVVLIAEGEKDALHLQEVVAGFPDNDGALNYAATCNVGGAGRWLDEYSPYLAGKKVFVFEDNDEPGRRHAQQVCTSVAKMAQSVHLLELPGLPEHGDVSDYLQGHKPSELLALMQETPRWSIPATPTAGSRVSSEIWLVEGMDKFLTGTEGDLRWYVPDVLAPGCLTEIFAPRGLGKSLIADHWAVQLAATGKRVLILDRDNPRHTLRNRLTGFGADEVSTLKVMSRDKCPSLTTPEKWAHFPYADYDIVIADSLDSMAEGAGEQDSSKPAKAMAPLLDICHRENGPAILLLGNTIKSAAHSRGSGVVEDRADIVYELRDGTDFKPTGAKPWIEELPAQGAADWMARSARRKGRTVFRVALIATKFRDAEEPAPRMLEINVTDALWTVIDVTAAIDEQGESERLRKANEKAAKHTEGVALLIAEIGRRANTGQPAILKKDAEDFLVAAKYTRKDARAIMMSNPIVAVPRGGKGNPLELHVSMKEVAAAKMQECSEPNKNEDAAQADFCRPHLQHAAEMDPSHTLINRSNFQPAISAAESFAIGEKKDGGMFDVEV